MELRTNFKFYQTIMFPVFFSHQIQLQREQYILWILRLHSCITLIGLNLLERPIHVLKSLLNLLRDSPFPCKKRIHSDFPMQHFFGIYLQSCYMVNLTHIHKALLCGYLGSSPSCRWPGCTKNPVGNISFICSLTTTRRKLLYS